MTVDERRAIDEAKAELRERATPATHPQLKRRLWRIYLERLSHIIRGE
jgi:hypothetical protein